MSKSTFQYIGKRLLISMATLLIILSVLFLLLKLMPGTPFNDEKLTDQQKEIIFEKYGMNEPVPVQFVIYLKNMLTGDFGISYSLQKNMEVTTLIGPKIGISFTIGISAVILGTVVGICLGTFAALHKNKLGDTLATIFAVIGVSIPSFVMGLLLLLIFGVELRVLPIIFNSSEMFVSSILPVIALSLSVTANVARFTRSEMIGVLASDYILLAESKGLDRGTIIRRHTLRNSIIPVVTILGPILVNLLTGSMVLEKIFAIPGLGKTLVDAIAANDHNVIMAIAFLYSLLYVVIMLVVDISYGLIDPRIRLGKEKG